MWVAGADGCPAGWLVVFRSAAGRERRARIFGAIADALAAPERPKLIAVDIPIGLPGTSKRGGRAADREARKALGRDRQSSVFPTPSRPTLAAASFAEACEIEQRNSAPPKKISQQVFNILRKIREVDAIARRRRGVIFECHPELSFWAMNNGVAMKLPKKGSGRKNPSGSHGSGLEERRSLLVRNGYTSSFVTTRVGSSDEHSPDDLIDACAAAWTAERILKNEATRLPSTADIDDCELDMAIWA
jgi:predicted RNase H-like nuclease